MNASYRFRELVYADYDGTGNHPIHEVLAQRAPSLKSLIAEHFPPDRDARVLEIGCGYGALLYFARQAGYRHLRGIDRSPSQVEMARAIKLDDLIELGDAMQLLAAEPDSSLDVLVSLDLIEHLTRPELLDFMAQMARILKPGGRWIINTVNGASPFFGRTFYGDPTHEQAFASASITRLLTLAGFTRVRCYEGRVIVRGLTSAARRVVWECFRAVMRLAMLAELGTARDAIFSQSFLVVAEK